MNNKFKGGLETQSHEIAVEELAVEGNIPHWLVEPVFVAVPEASTEDMGAVLSVGV
jgi:carotenoid cleavage dioxygenase-like enzyme